ncbi:MAG: glycosyltransferase family 2 protein, partial [Candidatus Orphnella occulta]|nr:glycosyltransferase family 2 protein [Candidatus Orphnella occulta]
CNWIRSKLSNTECKIGHLYFSNFLGIQLLNFIVRILYGAKITDEATCYKVFKKEVINKINLKSIKFEFCPEITAKVLKTGYGIVEVPISYYPRTTEHGKKIGWRDGLTAIYALIKYRFID